MNGDGDPDLVVTNWCHIDINCGGGVVGVLLGNGDGTFQAPISYGSGGGVDVLAVGVAIEDLNGDGRLDLVVLNNLDSVGVLLGNGDGTFRTAVNYSSGGWEPAAVAVGDVNGDGHPDLVVSNRYHSCCNGYGRVGVLLGNGDGTFQSAVKYTLGSFEATGVAIADVNGDGHPDLVVSSECYKSICNYGSVSVLLGNGDGTFPATFILKVGSDTNSVAVADVNGDGRPDLLVSCDSGSCSTGAVAVLLNLFPSTTTITSSLNPSTYGQAVALTATVGSNAPSAPTGTVTFKNAKTTVGSATLNASGVATLTRKTIPAGTDSITAVYNGDTRSAKSTSAVLLQTIHPASTSSTITSSVNPSAKGQTVTFTAKVTSPTTVPTGTVTFNDGGTALATVKLAGGKASYSTSTLPVGSHRMTAVYNGTPNITGSASPALVQIVN